MPKININEIDNSSRYTTTEAPAPMIVLVPGTASFGPEFSSDSPESTTFVGADDLNRFYDMYGKSAAMTSTDDGVAPLSGDLTFEYVSNLLQSGATVIFCRVNKGAAATAKVDGTSVIEAKYSGRAGNELVVEVTAQDASSGECVVSVRRNTLNLTTDKLSASIKNLPLLTSVRVSDKTENKYFIGNVDLGYVKIEKSNLAAVAGKQFILADGLDFVGTVGEAVDDETASATTVTAIKEVYAQFNDSYLYDFDFAVCPAFIDDANYEAINEAMINLAATRKDIVPILDTPMDFSYDEVTSYAAEQNTSFGAIYAPWCSFVSNTTSKIVMAPPSLIFLKSVLLGMKSQTDAQLWYVPAGVTRASAPFIVSPMYQIGSTILDEFQNKHEYRVNPIMNLRNYGYCVYGNATTLQHKTGTKHSALESMNVRLLSNVIKKAIFNVCSGLAFEYNNSELWLKFYTKMDELLLYMKRHYALFDYNILMDATTVTNQDVNERRVPGKVVISPVLAGEYFDIDFEIAPSGVTFTTEEA